MDYSKIIKRSWDISFKNKWLWIYGLLLGGVGISYSGSSNNNLKNIQVPENAQTFVTTATDTFASWVSQVSPTTWILLILGSVIAMVVGISIAMVLNTWAKGALLYGVDAAEKDQPTNLASTSKIGLQFIKKLILLGIIGSLIGLGFVLSLILVTSLSFVLNKTIGILMAIILVLVFILGMILLAMVGIYAERLIVLKQYSPWDAWKKGLSLSKSGFLNTIIMAIINSSIGCLANLVLAIVLGIPALGLIWAGLNWTTGISLAVLGVSFFVINMLMRAFLTVFTYSNWNLFFKEVV